MIAQGPDSRVTQRPKPRNVDLLTQGPQLSGHKARHPREFTEHRVFCVVKSGHTASQNIERRFAMSSSKAGHQTFDDVDLCRQLQSDACWCVQWYKLVSNKDAVALLDFFLSFGQLRARESEADVF